MVLSEKYRWYEVMVFPSHSINVIMMSTIDRILISKQQSSKRHQVRERLVFAASPESATAVGSCVVSKCGWEAMLGFHQPDCCRNVCSIYRYL